MHCGLLSFPVIPPLTPLKTALPRILARITRVCSQHRVLAIRGPSFSILPCQNAEIISLFAAIILESAQMKN
jgi:hypothetical protein